MALVPSRPRDDADSSLVLTRDELLAMVEPETAAAYTEARGALKAAEASEVVLVLLVLAAIAALFLAAIATPVLLVAGVPVALARGRSRRRYEAKQLEARATAEWERPRHRVWVEPGADDVAVTVTSCTLDPFGAHRAIVEGGVAAGETATHAERRVALGDDVALHETVAELEADVTQRELDARERYAERSARRELRSEDAATERAVLNHVRKSTGRWR